MGWNITFDKTVVDLDDLAPEVFDTIADDTGGSWYEVYLSPGGNTARLYAVVSAAAQHAGIEVPSKPTTMREERKLLDMIEPTQDIAEKPFVDGFPQMPDAPEVGSSSGVPGDSDGLPTLSDDSPSVTS